MTSKKVARVHEVREQFEFMHSLYEIAKYRREDYELHRATVKIAKRPERVRMLVNTYSG